MSTSSLSTGAMEEQDHSVAEAVGGILEGISSKLPRANFTLDEVGIILFQASALRFLQVRFLARQSRVIASFS